MRLISRLFAAFAICAFAACAGTNSSYAPAHPSASGVQRLAASGMDAMPGDGMDAMPGASLSCGLPTQQGTASCTIAININVPPIGNPAQPASELPGLHPSDLQNAYALPVQNAGGLVAIVDAYDDPAAESDLAVYRTAFGLPSCTSSNGCFRKVNQSGQSGSYPTANAGWDEEIALDLDMVSAACPNCSILLVEANSPSIDDLGAGVDTAASLGATAISNSYYATEWSGESAENAHYDHPGISITVSAGDQAQPYYPAAAPGVTSVGGTTLSGSAGSWSQSAWSYGGRGCSEFISKPWWQNVVTTGCATRSTVDVAAVADPQTGVSMYDSLAGGWLVAGGTSVGSPLLAAAYALAANGEGPSYAYMHRSAFNDVPPAGYDQATGLGTPNGVGGL